MIPERIRTELMKLSKDELRELKKHIDALIQLGADRDPTPGEDHDWLTGGIWVALARKGLVEQTFIPLQVKACAPKNYAETNKKLREFMLSHSRTNYNYAELIALGHLCGRSLVEYLSWSKYLGLRFVLHNISKLPEAFEYDYPSYLECGQLDFVVRRYLIIGEQVHV